jgi:hypothetical protein
MRELVRGRDVILFRKGENYPVSVTPAMAAGGWPGGQGVQWAAGAPNEFTVTYSDGLVAGFLLWGSNESADQFTAVTGNQPHYRFATMMSGGALYATTSYERFTYASRIGGGPGVPIVYGYNDGLFMSLRGLWTKEDEWVLSSDPRGSLFDNPVPGVSGMVVHPPTSQNQFFMTIQTL